MKKSFFLDIFAKISLVLLFSVFQIVSGVSSFAYAGNTVQVDIKGGFEPFSISIQPGITVEWRNREDAAHSVVSDTGVFTSGAIPKGGKFSYTFAASGNYPYSDPTSSYKGTITVLGSTSAPPPDTTPAPPVPTTLAINVGDDFFSSAIMSVAAGTTVTWANTGRSPHTVTSDTGIFSSGTMNTGASYAFTFQTAGTYSYRCIFHNGMTGSITVTGGDTTTSVNPSTPPPAQAPAPTPPPASAPIPPSALAPNTVQIGDNFFSPTNLSVMAGTTVTWMHTGIMPHSVTSQSGLLDSGMLTPGRSFTYTFQNPGTYPYYCIFHSGQSGTVTVSGSGASQNSANQQMQTTSPAGFAVVMVSQGGNGVLVADNVYFPVILSVNTGTAVTWVNIGHATHSVTSDTGFFDSGIMNPGQGFTFTFQNPGTYLYHSTSNEGQSGTVVVSDRSRTTASQPEQMASSNASTATKPTEQSIAIGDNTYSPGIMSLAKGTAVKWTNTGHLPHTVTSDTGLFDSGMLKPGQSFTFTFDQPDSYSYHCIYHSGQSGNVKVADEVGAPAAASASAETTSLSMETHDMNSAPAPEPALASPPTSVENSILAGNLPGSSPAQSPPPGVGAGPDIAGIRADPAADRSVLVEETDWLTPIAQYAPLGFFGVIGIALLVSLCLSKILAAPYRLLG
ncbi:MAG: cupredoxin domain-containing protein [Chloroflexi bacterium]|nr:cupredoxin domain-containing protein [Chloroflexota bacterium]